MVQKNLEKSNQELRQKEEQIKEGQAEIGRLDHALKEQTEKTNQAMREYEALNQNVQSLSRQLKDAISSCSHWMAENSTKKLELTVKEEQISQIKADFSKMTKVRETLLRKIQQLEKEKADIETSKDELRV